MEAEAKAIERDVLKGEGEGGGEGERGDGDLGVDDSDDDDNRGEGIGETWMGTELEGSGVEIDTGAGAGEGAGAGIEEGVGYEGVGLGDRTRGGVEFVGQSSHGVEGRTSKVMPSSLDSVLFLYFILLDAFSVHIKSAFIS